MPLKTIILISQALPMCQSDLVQLLIRSSHKLSPPEVQRGEVTYWMSHSKEVEEQIYNTNNNSRKIIMG